MTTLLIVFSAMVLFIIFMSAGLLLGGKPVSGSCGGMSAVGMKGACDVCGGDTSTNGKYKNTGKHFHDDHPDAPVGTPHPEGRRGCPNEFETTYAPERLDVVYCEKCYQGEVI